MIRAENIDVWGFEHSIRGMRNPKNSWDRSDSASCVEMRCYECNLYDNERYCCDHDYEIVVGKNDMELMQKLCKAGSEHRKFMRQIFISMDVVAPLYWWKEMDQYRISVTSNSCSTMHKIHAKEFELDDFSHEHLSEGEYGNIELLKSVITCLNVARDWFIKTKDKDFWWQMIQLLPTSYNQRRTITMNYENALSMIKQRAGHKLDEWHVFVDVLKGLPYMKEIAGFEE